MAKERTVILTIGLPASAKTSWATEFVRKNDGWVRVNRDDFRFMLQNKPVLEFKAEDMVTDLVIATVRKALLTGYNVIVDNTHCRLKYINALCDELNDLATIEFRYFDVPAKVCIERDEKRERKVGPDVINKMAKDLSIMLETFDFQTRKKKPRNPKDYSEDWSEDLQPVVISDIDGTLCHMLDRRGPFEWHKVGRDRPDHGMIEVLRAWKATGKTIILVSGRDSVCREETIEWMKEYDVPFDHLFMRPKDDFRKDSLVKREIYENEIKDKFNVVMIYDDRDQVVQTWRELGLKCAQVEPGSF